MEPHAATKRVELWLRVPLGIWPGKYDHLERLETTIGWHYWYLLVTLDTSDRFAGWRLQWQRKGVPLTRAEPWH